MCDIERMLSVCSKTERNTGEGEYCIVVEFSNRMQCAVVRLVCELVHVS